MISCQDAQQDGMAPGNSSKAEGLGLWCAHMT
jgi:hypothetical protein